MVFDLSQLHFNFILSVAYNFFKEKLNIRRPPKMVLTLHFFY